MRRWLAIPVAAIIAVAVGAVSWQSGTPAEAGAPPLTFAVDCNTSTVGVQSYCVLSQGTVTADVVLTNGTGGAVQLQASEFVLTASPGGTTTFVPNVVACSAPALNCNPDFDPTSAFSVAFDCSGSLIPSPDINADGDPGTAQSKLACTTVTFGAFHTLADGASIVLGRVTYTASADSVYALDLNNAAAYDESFGELGTCEPVLNTAAICTDATMQIGASANTPTPVNTATPTSTSTSTPEPCVGAACPTATTLAYRTVTPTGTITVAGDTPVPGVATTAPPPPPPPAGGAPGGTTAGGGRGGIRLPDTGTGTGTSANDTLSLFTLLAIAVAAIAGGSLWHSMSAAADRRED